MTYRAAQLAPLLPSSSGNSDSFTAFAFRALNLVAQGLVETGKRPSIKQLRYYIEGGAEAVLVNAIEAHADRIDPDWKVGAESFFIKAKAGKAKKMETITNPDWLATRANGSCVEFIHFFPFVVSLSNHIQAFCKYLFIQRNNR